MGEEVNRFFAWEICPGGEFQSCHWGRLSHSPQEPGQWGRHLPFWCCFFLSAVPPPCEGLQARGHLQSTPKDRSLTLFWDRPPCPGG